MLNKFRTYLTATPIYAGLLALLLGLFIWAEWTGTRLLGSDNYETEKHGYGVHSGGRGYRGRTGFYHK